MTRRIGLAIFAALFLCNLGAPAIKRAEAHFGMIIPKVAAITQTDRKTELSLSFSHPFENIGMDMVRPKKFSVSVNGNSTDLTNTLEPATFMGHKSWTTSYAFQRPGVYSFIMEPTPYWEPAEDVSIIHYTKTIIPAYGEDVGWDQAVGLPTEIVPLLRPFGNYQGNTFVGQVLLKGQPVPAAEVEVELYNPSKRLTEPSDYHITQVVKADANGIFTFTCPLPGWWGFAALSEADYTIKDPDGKDKGVELGAVLWTYFHPLPQRNK